MCRLNNDMRPLEAVNLVLLNHDVQSRSPSRFNGLACVKNAEMDKKDKKGKASNIAELICMGREVTEKVRLPLMPQQGRRDLFDYELDFMSEQERRAVCERTAVDLSECGPSDFCCSHINGKIIEHKCAACGQQGEFPVRFL